MSDTEIVWLIGATVGFALGFGLGHGRGYIAGVRWCTKRLDDDVGGGKQP